ncbi:vacuolar protein sorting 45B [Guillardia theta CCMP2712]|uniref:Vacuolar protein sorting 45B n=1 Tax=Guillardia theta (strain CCMP2712) TaxID=905079 RepID=L1K1M3_GUITC|nr:vacuolar protein sorting 45B [Guillardia theta CCMP2712]EKX54512.1 vacuolar protein sorting 45B [Guillardia theta CCMP2712]|mmetsp:Transcript_52047/g.161838  ORF Transcript_52047/g.161838 Transcript_52047/m.161838 type:complete len:592 (-) Transcript_52047:97-1872(-)|eukprot:XP_005841492.1 vacuolar protein sorting 45B [Guillardia theta CCMP2712]
MDVIHAVQQYVSRMTEGVGGMKALLLDKETTAIVSMVISRSQVLEKEVFLFQRLDAGGRGRMLHLKALVFLRPTRENIELLAKELLQPMFGEYHLFFSNVLSNDAVRTLAQADTYEVVKQVRELYADFYSLSPSCFSLNLPPNSALSTPLADRTRDGIFALLLALKKKPAIRYQASSRDAEHIAALLSQHLDQQQDTLDFGRNEDMPPLLLILDRTDDPLTPLLNQWTYQAMVHELLGIRNNLVEVPRAAGSDADPTSIVLSAVSDDFFKENMHTDYGAMNDAVQAKLEELKRNNPQFAQMWQGNNAKLGTIAEMQRIIEKYPEMSKMKDNISKHVNLLHTLAKMVDQYNLLEVSEIEQQLAAVQDHKSAHKQVMEMLGNSNVRQIDKLRLVLLYALRYQKEGGEKGYIQQLARMLPAEKVAGAYISQGGAEELMPTYQKFPEILLRECGAGARTPQSDLFNRGVNAVVSQGFKSITNNAGSDNAYMLHQPLLEKILKSVEKGRLPEDKYPFRPCSTYKEAVDAMRAFKRGPSELIVYIVGGATYAESRVVSKFNDENRHCRVILGGSCFLSTHSFLESIAARAASTLPHQ